MSRRKTWNKEPKEIEANYASRCPQTGRQINIGDRCVYYPSSGKVYHIDSEAAQRVRRMSYAS